MRTAVQDVHHRYRQRGRGASCQRADVLVQGTALRQRVGTQGGHRNAEQGVGAQAPLGRRAVERNHRRVEASLVVLLPLQGRGEFAIDVADRGADALAKIARHVTIAKLKGFALAGGGAGGHRGAPERAVRQRDIDFNGGVAA